MPDNLSQPDKAERDAIIAGIHSAFADVDCGDDGISWNECVAIDDWASEKECQAARRSDTDLHWSELIDNPQWDPFPGSGGFSFINAEGFRYYLPPTMIRFLRDDELASESKSLLNPIQQFTGPRVIHLWSEDQLQSIARFIAFMARHCAELLDPREPNLWADSLEHRWSQYIP